MNTFLNELKEQENYGVTENGAIKHNSTLDAVLDMFALGGAFRYRTDDDCIDLFGKAFDEDPELALKCLFYIGDCRGGQGERRFFRVCFRWLANFYPTVAGRNLPFIPEYRRWDDVLYSCIDTPIEDLAFALVKDQLAKDVQTSTPSLLGKWLPSENASSTETRQIANKVRQYLGMSHKQYRKTLSVLRSRINVLEKLMSEGKWDQIQFDGIPSKAGLNYRNAFATREETKDRYKTFLESKDVKVNASVLTPVDVVHKAMNCPRDNMMERKALNQYWKDLPDYYGDVEENGIAVVDVSGSMWGTPMEAAIGLGAYIAERGHGPFANHFITFSARPQLVKFRGADIVEKVNNCQNADWGYNTNIEAVFDLLLRTAQSKNTKPEDMPTRLYILSDMEFDYGLDLRHGTSIDTLLESIAKRWRAAGYELPQVVFWNLDARSNNIPAIGGRFSYVSGFSPVMIPQILGHVSAEEIMKEKLLSKRYAPIK